MPADFRRDGFVVVRGLYDSREIQEISDWIEDLAVRPPEKGGMMVYFEESLIAKDEKILSRIEKFSDFHPGFRNFVQADKMAGRVSGLLGEPAVLFKEKINFKMPGGGGFTPHQDIQPGWDEYASYFLSVLVAVDDSTVENGCLELAAGHHRRGLIGRKWEPLEGEELKGIEFKKFPMAPGDVAFFDCFVPHQSGPNLTDKPRRNIYLTFNRLSEGDHREHYFADKRKSYPPDYEREPGKEYIFRV
ncbi:MAG: phytanoyl-CoA dioxygenase family protein [Candidatus Omnitrophica bacterium]|nr:phytanoyl-CoA dioxygenase family protein [Candidatus Omnitrophota bacterium]